ncbi:MAG: hypothetical protein KJ850_05450, partial [Gammaproteobacteria bacterium]|nr:hypothetical protein [Gammaproteobacteria bacterium]MBU1982322.1 hypothetical protein [Gammaproteobacteria bacterium]
MPPIAGNNEKGFFEDTEISALNSELLSSIGQDWHTLALVPTEEFLQSKYAECHQRAKELLRSRLAQAESFGMKDPRMCRLLPFWQKVFAELGLKDAYVIATRNPLSVAQSLKARDNLPPEKSHYLWLEHILPSVLLTQGKPRVLVDYDRLMAEPERQIARMATGLGMESSLDAARLTEFTKGFLDKGLQHTSYTLQDVAEAAEVPDPVKSAVLLLDEIASDRISLEAEASTESFARLAKQMEGMANTLSHQECLDAPRQIAELSRAVHDKGVHIVNIERALGERSGEVAALSQAVHDKDVHIVNIERALGERTGEVATLSQAVHDKDVHIVNIERALGER